MEHAAHLLHVDHDSIASLPIHHEHNVHRATPSQTTGDENVGLVETNDGPLGSRISHLRTDAIDRRRNVRERGTIAEAGPEGNRIELICRVDR